MPDLVGKYVFGDFAVGRIWVLEVPPLATHEVDPVGSSVFEARPLPHDV